MIRNSLPQPAPTLEGLWSKARAGLIPWSDVQDYQSSIMPRCVNHAERSAPASWGDKALCVECFAVVSLRTDDRG